MHLSFVFAIVATLSLAVLAAQDTPRIIEVE
jgi:hypothetical protein